MKSFFLSVGPTGQAIFGAPLRGFLDGILAGPPTQGSRPVERALLDNPNVSDDQDTEKHQHLGQSE